MIDLLCSFSGYFWLQFRALVLPLPLALPYMVSEVLTSVHQSKCSHAAPRLSRHLGRLRPTFSAVSRFRPTFSAVPRLRPFRGFGPPFRPLTPLLGFPATSADFGRRFRPFQGFGRRFSAVPRLRPTFSADFSSPFQGLEPLLSSLELVPRNCWFTGRKAPARRGQRRVLT
jgi:hypothetical protein